jgi:hypothetical protein
MKTMKMKDSIYSFSCPRCGPENPIVASKENTKIHGTSAQMFIKLPACKTCKGECTNVAGLSTEEKETMHIMRCFGKHLMEEGCVDERFSVEEIGKYFDSVSEIYEGFETSTFKDELENPLSVDREV